jgi:hypothetical protein
MMMAPMNTLILERTPRVLWCTPGPRKLDGHCGSAGADRGGGTKLRAKRRRLLRNVAVAQGNWGSPEAVPLFAVALNDEEPLVRGHAAWALGRIGTEAGGRRCRGGKMLRRTHRVREEIAGAPGS